MWFIQADLRSNHYAIFLKMSQFNVEIKFWKEKLVYHTESE